LITGIAAQTLASKRSRATLGDELLVRGHDRLSGREQVDHQASRGLDSAHHLGDNGDRGVVPDGGRVRRQDARIGQEVALLLDVPYERADHLQPVSGCALDVLRVLDEKPVDRGADRSVAQEADSDDVAEASQPLPPTPHGA
jgi:hypothetical protein